jgi:hypothetical protein
MVFLQGSLVFREDHVPIDFSSHPGLLWREGAPVFFGL